MEHVILYHFRVLTAGPNRLLARMSSTAMVAKVQMDSIVSQVKKLRKEEEYNSDNNFQLGSEYTRDILAWLRSRELTTPGCRQQVFQVIPFVLKCSYILVQSPQLASRRHLVEWSTEVRKVF